MGNLEIGNKYSDSDLPPRWTNERLREVITFGENFESDPKGFFNIFDVMNLRRSPIRVICPKRLLFVRILNDFSIVSILLLKSLKVLVVSNVLFLSF